MKRKVQVFSLVVLALFLFGGCALFQRVKNPISMFMEMPPKQKLTVAMDLYNKVYDDSEKTLSSASSTPDQKKIAAEKVKILVKYHKAIQVYRIFVDAGVSPSADDEESLIEFVNELAKKGVSI